MPKKTRVGEPPFPFAQATNRNPVRRTGKCPFDAGGECRRLAEDGTQIPDGIFARLPSKTERLPPPGRWNTAELGPRHIDESVCSPAQEGRPLPARGPGSTRVVRRQPKEAQRGLDLSHRLVVSERVDRCRDQHELPAPCTPGTPR